MRTGQKTLKSYKEGMHRAVEPSKTYERVSPFLEAMGITRVANVTGLDRLGIPVFNAYRPNSRSLSVAQGKGLTESAARTSAVMEAIEIYHAEDIKTPRLNVSYHELSEIHRPLDVNGLAYLRGTTFDKHRSFPWIEGKDLITGAPVWLPFELVHTDYTLPRAMDAGCFVASTNGLASGNRPLEAIVHGIYEVIERDAHTLWHLSTARQKAQTRIDMSTITSAMNGEVIRKLNNAHMEVGLWDMTSDLGVPTIHCLITDKRDGGHSGGGAGTHLNRDIALLRALTEAAQVRTNYITGARDDLGLDEYGTAGIDSKDHQARRLMDQSANPERPFDATPSYDFETFEEDLDFLLQRLQDIGVSEAITVDLSKAEFDIPVSRIVIPGLEGPHDHDAYQMGSRAHRYVEAAKT